MNMTRTSHPDRTKMPLTANFEKLELKTPEEIRLDNGLPVFLIPGDEPEVTRLDLVFDAGSAFQEVKLQAAAVNDLLADGTRHHSSFEIAEILDFHGAYTDFFLTKDTAGITLYGLTKHYHRLLPLMAEMITEAVFPEEEVAIFLERRKQEFQVNKQKVRYLASQGFNKLIFGENSAYGQVLEEEDFERLNRSHLLDFYRRYYAENRFKIILSGKIDNTLLQNLNRILGQPVLPSGLPDRKSEIHFVLPGSEQKMLVEKKEALQSALRIGTLSMAQNHPDFAGLNLLNTVLGGYFGSRLMRSVREEKGYTYGIYSALQTHRHATLFGIATEVNARHTKDALKEIERQMLLLCREKIAQDELQTVKNYVYGSYLRSFDGPLQVADRFRKSLELELPFSFYRELLDRMMRLTPEDLFPLAAKYLNPENMKTLVVGDISQLK
jgi:zinc protease